MNRLNPFSSAAGILLALALAGCVSVGPDYHAAAPTVPKLLNVDPMRENNGTFQAQWWKQFGDPTLDALIQMAALDNLDLRIAQARLRESRALVSGAESAQIPTVAAGTSFERAYGQYPGITTDQVRYDVYRAGFDASWELDLFGGIRREVEASKAERDAQQAALRGTQVSVIGEVARNYFVMRGSQARIAIVENDIGTLRETLRLVQAQAKVGTGSEQDVASAGARLSAVEAQLPDLRIAEQTAQFRLAVLLGKRPGELGVDLSSRTSEPIAVSLPMGPIGDVLARRPDVQEAERRLAASTARIGVAKADFYPHVSLSGFLGFLSSHGTDFLTAGSQAWSIMPGITWDGLNVQRVRANLHAAQARSDAAQAIYEQSILVAIEDVDSAVTSYNETHARVGKLIDQFAQSHRAADLARVRYREGSTGFLELLDAERVELAAGDDLAQAESDINVRAVALYKSLGGGWEACGGERCDGLAQTQASTEGTQSSTAR
ncbi:UNVERIFIED_ORG: multidrug efflux system outer membrane protein [Paraburkholderia sediminicola]|nr:multidrug efflux system outer membrane protein [Paraburkholderia sediminicola]